MYIFYKLEHKMSFGPDDIVSRTYPAADTCIGPAESAGCCIESVKRDTESLLWLISAFTFLVSALFHHSGISRNTILMVELGNFCRLLTSPLLKGRVDSNHGIPSASR